MRKEAAVKPKVVDAPPAQIASAIIQHCQINTGPQSNETILGLARALEANANALKELAKAIQPGTGIYLGHCESPKMEGK